MHTSKIINVEDWEVLRKNTKWNLYRKIVIRNLNRLEECDTIFELKEWTVTLTNILTFCIACPPVHAKRGSRPPWWNKELGSRKCSVKKLLKLARMADKENCWREYKDVLNEYKNEIRKAKR